MEVEKFLETCFENFDAKKSFAQRIFATFMENGLPMQININKKIIEDARDALQYPNPINFDEIFSPAYQEIYNMLTNVYSDFEKNEFYGKMISDLTSESEAHDSLSMDQNPSISYGGSIYPLKAYYNALDSITYTVGCMEKIFDEQIASKRISVNRHRIIRRMIVGFCEQRLKMDFPESTLNLRQSLLTNSGSDSINPRASIVSNLSVLSNISQSNSALSVKVKRKDELDLF